MSEKLEELLNSVLIDGEEDYFEIDENDDCSMKELSRYINNKLIM